MSVRMVEKKTFSVFDVFLVLLLALAVSLAVYFFLENPYGAGDGNPAYELTMNKSLEYWEEEILPEERDRLEGQRLYNENGEAVGKIVEVIETNDDSILKLRCRWNGDLKNGKTFRLETVDYVIYDMRITRIMPVEG